MIKLKIKDNLVKILISCFAISFFFFLLIFVNINLYKYAEDDAFIHFRLAEHLAQFGLPYFNIDEPVFTTSSTVWTLLLAVLTKISNNLPLIVAYMNALLVGIGGLLYARIIYLTTENNILIYIIPPIYAGILMHSSIGLMEAPLAMLVIGYGLYKYLNNKPVSFTFFSLAVFIRLELVVFLIMFLIKEVLKKNFEWKSILGYSAIGSLPFLIFELYYFKTIIPNTIIAKSIVYQIPWLNVFGSIYFNSLPNLQVLKTLTPYWQIVYVSLILTLTGYVFLFIVRKRRDLYTHLLVLLAGISIFTLYLARAVLIFPWYVPLFLVPIVISIFSIYSSKMSFPSILFVLLISTPFFLNFVQTTIAAAGNPNLYIGFETGARVRQYLKIGEDLDKTNPDAVLMTSEIGGLGYSFKGRIRDAAGLASPEALRFHPMKVPEERSGGEIGAIPVGFIEEIQPDIIVSYDIFIEAFLLSDLQNNYVRIKKPLFLQKDMSYFSGKSFWNSVNLNIFYRNDFPFRPIN